MARLRFYIINQNKCRQQYMNQRVKFNFILLILVYASTVRYSIYK